MWRAVQTVWQWTKANGPYPTFGCSNHDGNDKDPNQHCDSAVPISSSSHNSRKEEDGQSEGHTYGSTWVAGHGQALLGNTDSYGSFRKLLAEAEHDRAFISQSYVFDNEDEGLSDFFDATFRRQAAAHQDELRADVEEQHADAAMDKHNLRHDNDYRDEDRKMVIALIENLGSPSVQDSLSVFSDEHQSKINSRSHPYIENPLYPGHPNKLDKFRLRSLNVAGQICVIDSPSNSDVVGSFFPGQILNVTGPEAAYLCDTEVSKQPAAVIVCHPYLCNPRYGRTRKAQEENNEVPTRLLEFADRGGTIILAPCPRGGDGSCLAVNDFLQNDAGVPWKFSTTWESSLMDLGDQDLILRRNSACALHLGINEITLVNIRQLPLLRRQMWLSNVFEEHLLYVPSIPDFLDNNEELSGPFAPTRYGEGFLGWFGFPFDQTMVRSILLPMLGLGP